MGHTLLLPIIQESLEAMNVRCKAAPSEPGAPLRLRIGGYDKRKIMFKGWVTVEKFVYGGNEWTFCVMQRDVVSDFLPLLAMAGCGLIDGRIV